MKVTAKVDPWGQIWEGPRVRKGVGRGGQVQHCWCWVRGTWWAMEGRWQHGGWKQWLIRMGVIESWGWVRRSSFQGSGRQEAKEEGGCQGKAPEGMGPELTRQRGWGPC